MSKTIEFLDPIYKRVGIYEVSLNEKNVRKLSKKGFSRLKKKILENVYEPLKVRGYDNVVISGNQRLSVIRSLVEDEGYDIETINVAIYDIDERTAKFIELSDNEHEGEYDFEKLIEEFDEYEELGLHDILSPKVTSKVKKLIDEGDIKDLDTDAPDNDIVGTAEVAFADLIICGVPKTELEIFHQAVTKYSKETKIRNEWKCLRGILEQWNSHNESVKEG